MKGALHSHAEAGGDVFSSQRRIAEEILLCEQALQELNDTRFACEIQQRKRQSFKRFIRRRRVALENLRSGHSCAARAARSAVDDEHGAACRQGEVLQAA